MTDSIRQEYEDHGVAEFYRTQGTQYRNPHEQAIREAIQLAVARWPLDLSYILDLACGSGEATLMLRELGAAAIEGIDPYTGAAYAQRTGQLAEPFSFEDITAGALADRRYSLIVCSYALHLVAESRLPLLCYRLAEVSPALLILTPHKRPQIQEAWGWKLEDELLHKRVHMRCYGAVMR